MIGEALTDAGCEAVVSPAADIRDLAGFDAVIIASAMYANRWHRDARRFVRRNSAALRELPVWLVSSGPLDDSAEQHDIPPTSRCGSWPQRWRTQSRHVRWPPDTGCEGLPRQCNGQEERRRLVRPGARPPLGSDRCE